jgi:putative membrane protein
MVDIRNDRHQANRRSGFELRCADISFQKMHLCAGLRLNLLSIMLTLSGLLWIPAACAHVSHEHNGGSQFGWAWEPWVLVLLGISGILYFSGWLRMHKQGNAKRILGVARPLSFIGGLLALFIALISPLDTLAEHLFCAHMTQHLFLMLIAPPLLVWSRPILVWLWAFPLEQRRQIGRVWIETPALHSTHAFLMQPVVVWLYASVALWFWHIPGPYNWALSNEGVHTLEHICFFVTSLAFWTLVMEPYGPRKISHGTALVMVSTYAMHNGLLGALLTFASTPLYHTAQLPLFGLTALEDQQLAGLIMWVPASIVHLVSLGLLFVGWLSNVKAYRSEF